MKKVGDQVVLNGKTYTVAGFHKRSYLLTGADGKTYKCGPEKLDRIEAGIPRQSHRRTTIQDNMTMPATDAGIIQAIRDIEGALSPENLFADGERSRSAAHALQRRLLTRQAQLLKALGRQPTEQELYGV